MKRGQFAFADILTDHGLCYLNIELFICVRGDKVNLSGVNLADCHIVSAAQELKVDDIFQNMTGIPVPKTEQIIAQADIRNIVFSERAQKLPALDVKSFDFIENVGFQQRSDIRLNRMGAGEIFSASSFQETFVYQRVSNGIGGDGASDIVGKEQNDLPEKIRIGDLALTAAFLSFKNVTDNDSRVYSVQKSKRALLIQTDIGDAGHAAEMKIGVEDLAKVIRLPVRIRHFLFGSAEGTYRVQKLKIMEVQELLKGKRKHLNFNTPTGKIYRVF